MTPRALTIPYLLDGAFRPLACTAWGDQAGPPVACVHGLTRQGRDFDVLAQSLARGGRFVVCPDLPGRGGSAWLADPAGYSPVGYAAALSHLLAWLARPVDWVGTSLGGLCGMQIAAMPGAPIRRMVLNDIGPFIPKAALQRIAAYTAAVPDFGGPGDVEAYLRRIHAPFGALSDADWAAMARHSSRRREDGSLALHYDPAITASMQDTEPQDVDLWAVWERISVPMLVLRGETSDLLLAETAARMGGKASLHEVAGTGHAPGLMDAGTIGVIQSFLKRE